MSSDRKNHQILIVDDNPRNIQVLGTVLSEKGYNIIIANDGIQTLKTVEKIIPDLILLDINMPTMDGFETCRKLKESELYSEIPVIFLTARTETEDIIKGFHYGAVDYITKPFNQAELLARVKTHLELRDKSEELKERNLKVQELLRVLLHDLSNPLSGIKGVIDFGQTNPEIYSSANELMKRAVNNCFSIIDNVRKMRAVDEGKMEIQLQRFPLKECIQESLLLFDKRLQEKNLEVILDVPEGLNVLADKAIFLNSVFSNILTNAVKFSFPNSKIEVSAFSETEGRTVLSVKDSGIGMPDWLLQDIFSPVKPTTRRGTSGEEGTGFGMPLVKKFIEYFQGTIEIFSSEKEPKGTEVKIYLKS
ncbi:MAG TPA: hybrid sensor histidine kinase/response regulator [Leptospiraceae bacterium]|nr:hybrid sensor histidine kinase/response regulator [Leptospiraceae bacterium]HMY66570.1 hybrid sensor histidine kinase/response regulator [Leptospiraceae bacterium]HMZ57318.1 hybrid sensor histidine kinase/response regulator [Leptospiraceae bacterium]HNF14579.1 hybrid sensor histidine kinase/response regulator [Leptospiraceae bacterium]HNF24164.1 hybrid sensor histidine kinase/response regulator [Leptospiraceae bacterium]